MQVQDFLERVGNQIEDLWEGVTSAVLPAALAAAAAAPAASTDSYVDKAAPKMGKIISSAQALGFSTVEILPLVEEARTAGIDLVLDLPRYLEAAQYAGINAKRFKTGIAGHVRDGGLFVESLSYFHQKAGLPMPEDIGRELWNQFDRNLSSDLMGTDVAGISGEFDSALRTAVEQWLTKNLIQEHGVPETKGLENARAIIAAADRAGVPVEQIPGIVKMSHNLPPAVVLKNLNQMIPAPRPSRPLEVSPGVSHDTARALSPADALGVASKHSTGRPLGEAIDAEGKLGRGKGAVEKSRIIVIR